MPKVWERHEEDLDNLQGDLDVLKSISFLDIETADSERWPDAARKHVADMEKLVRSAAGDFSSLNVAELPSGAVCRVAKAVKDVRVACRRLRQPELQTNRESSSAEEVGDALGLLDEAVASFMSTLAPWFLWLGLRSGSAQDLLARYGEGIAELEAGRQRVSDALADIDRRWAEHGVDAAYGRFQETARSLSGKARMCLLVSGGLAALAVVAVVGLPLVLPPVVSESSGAVDTALAVFSRISPPLILVGVAGWVARLYSALGHQAAVYRQRALALRTFMGFAEAAKDPAVQDMILIGAAKSIFDHQPTGMAGARSAGASALSGIEFRSPVHKGLGSSDNPD